MQRIKIDKGIPLPDTGRGTLTYPFAGMQVGDSFAAPIDRERALRQRVYLEHQREPTRRYTVRRLSDGKQKQLRVWRIR